MDGILSPNGMRSWSHDLFKFWEITGNISETVRDREIFGNRTWPIEWQQY